MHLHREKKDVVSKKKDPADKLLHVGLSQTRNKSNMNKEITCLPLPQITDPIIMDPVSMTWRKLQQKLKIMIVIMYKQLNKSMSTLLDSVFQQI